MAEYIELEGLIEWLKRIPLIDLSDGRGLCRVIMEDDFKKAIKKMPKGIIADVAPVLHARWWKQDDYSCCSVCGQSIADECVPWFKFCPQCGAKMDLEG